MTGTGRVALRRGAAFLLAAAGGCGDGPAPPPLPPPPPANPVPSISALSPVAVDAGTAGLALTVDGTGFVSGSVVRWNGQDRATTFAGATRLTAAITAADLAQPGTAQVTVFNPAPGGGVSAAANLTVRAVLRLAPGIAATAPGGVTDFTARDHTGAAQPAGWRVSGIPGGSAAVGVVTADGWYTAPATAPAADSVVVTAVLASDTTVRAAAAVFFVPDAAARDYTIAVPRVVAAAVPRDTRFLVVPPAAGESVAFVPPAGAPVPLEAIGSGVFTFVLDVAAALAGYTTGTLHNFVGRLDHRDAAGAQLKLVNLSVNVRDATMPDVAVTALAPDAQRSPHVLNLRVDSALAHPTAPVVARALALLGGDRFDFVTVIAPVVTTNNRVYIAVRNDVQGIGLPVFDNSAAWGGAGRLRGVIAFPIDGFFDGAEGGLLHEIGHAWINFATDAVLGPARPHWPPSTMASGTMGFNIPGTVVGGQFGWSLEPLGDGTVRLARTTPSDRFTPIDLYLMGLLPPDSVPPMYVLPAATDPAGFTDGMVLPATTYMIAEYIAAHGARLPASPASPRDFALAVVVLSHGRLLTPAEMAFFDHAAARAETQVPLQSTVGLVTRTASGFLLATGGRATLRSRLP